MRNFREEYRNELNQLQTGVHLDAERILAAAETENALVPAKAHSRRRAWTRVAAAAAVLILCSAGTVTAVNLRRSYIRVEEQGYTVSKEEPDVEVAPALGAEGMTGIYDELPDELTCEEVIDEGREYTSLAAFRESEDLTFVCPEPEWLTGGQEPREETVYVFDDGDTISYVMTESDEKYLYVNQWDVRDAEDYGSSTVYAGTTANERTYVTESGFDFLLFDSQEDGQLLSTHAVISLNGWELNLDFYGYSEETIESALDRLELEVYMQ